MAQPVMSAPPVLLATMTYSRMSPGLPVTPEVKYSRLTVLMVKVVPLPAAGLAAASLRLRTYLVMVTFGDGVVQ